MGSPSPKKYSMPEAAKVAIGEAQRRIWADPGRRAERMLRLKKARDAREGAKGMYVKRAPADVQVQAQKLGDTMANIPTDPWEQLIFHSAPISEDEHGA